MRRFYTACCLLLLLAAGIPALASSQQPRTPAAEVIDAMLEALGGQDFLDVREMQSSGRYYSFRRGEIDGTDTFIDYVRFPDNERTEFGRDRNRSVMLNVGSDGWIIQGRDIERQAVSQTEDFLFNFRTSLDYVTRFVLRLPQTTLQNVGTEFIDFKRADIIEIRDPERNLIRLFIDQESRLPLRMHVRKAGESSVRQMVYSNWHRFQGVMTPLFVIRFTDDEKVMEIRLDQILYNPDLADSLFANPAAD